MRKGWRSAWLGALAALALAACSNLNCDTVGGSAQRGVGAIGACGGHVTFFADR